MGGRASPMFSAKAKLGLGVVRSSAWLAAVFVFALNGQERGPARLSLAFSFGGRQPKHLGRRRHEFEGFTRRCRLLELVHGRLCGEVRSIGHASPLYRYPW